jgi:dipeptidyl aminopeptidase/acylaminoacyl peptidase
MIYMLKSSLINRTNGILTSDSAGSRTSGLLALSAILLLLNCQITQAYSLDDWMTISSVEQFEWSPDGTYFIYTSSDTPSGADNIFRIPVAGGQTVRLGQDEPGVRPEPKTELSISSDGRFLYFTSARYFQAFLNIFRMPVTGGVGEALTFNDAVIQTSPAISPDGNTLAFFARTEAGAKIYTLDLTDKNAWPKILFPDNSEETFPAWSVNGDIAFRRSGDIWVLKRGDAEPRRVPDPAYGGGNSGHVWSPDGKHIAFINSQSGFSQIGVVNVHSGKVIPITHEPREHADLSWSADGQWLAYVRNDAGGMSKDLVVGRVDGSADRRVISKGKGFRTAPKFSPDGKYLAFLESTSVRTSDIWVADLSDASLKQITYSMGKIDPATLSEAGEISYPARDHLSIPGMLWLPPDFDSSRKYPVIVRLHGHPGQWNHKFQMMTQYFVNQGFVAIAPNPRGSVGFGQGFHDLHIADYGGEEFQDVMAVIPYLDSLGYIDMERKATWGGSGGGYMNLVIATEAPDSFQAQVIRAPVSSWKLMAYDRYGASARAWTATRAPRRERSEFGGSWAEIPDEYERRSPINYVENVTVPQLLFHGLRDTSVLPEQSRIWVKRMQELGKSDLIEFVQYPDEDHGLQRYKATVRDRIERMTEFFSRHLDLSELPKY